MSGCGRHADGQPDGHSGPVSNRAQLRQNLSVLPGSFCAQFLHHLSRGNTRLYAAHQVCSLLTLQRQRIDLSDSMMHIKTFTSVSPTHSSFGGSCHHLLHKHYCNTLSYSHNVGALNRSLNPSLLESIRWQLAHLVRAISASLFIIDSCHVWSQACGNLRADIQLTEYWSGLNFILFLAGIPAPIYFGAIIDTTCLKWSYKSCGGRGACRIYDTTAYR